MTLTGFMAWTWNTPSGLGPQMYSWYHIMWLIIMVGLSIGAVFFAKKYRDPKVVDRTVFIVDAILLVTELLKQVMYHVGYYGYLRIDVLPFSLCSIPMYVALIGSLVKNEKVKNACYGFLSFFGIVGGLTSMLYPITLETSLIYTSIQTMLWHTLLVAMAIYLIVARGFGKSFKKEIIAPSIIFIACSLIAVGLNELAYHAYLEPRQTPVLDIDRQPGSYQYYKYGFQNGDEYLYLDENLNLTEEYSKGVNVVITYPEGDNYSVYLLGFENSKGEDKYIEITDSKELTLVDTPTKNWEFAWIESDRAVFAMNVTGETYCLKLDNGSIKIENTSSYAEGMILADFIDGHVASEGDSANFFFISNHCKTPIPVLDLIQPHVPYPIFVLLYLGGFLAISSATFGVTYLINKITDKKES